MSDEVRLAYTTDPRLQPMARAGTYHNRRTMHAAQAAALASTHEPSTTAPASPHCLPTGDQAARLRGVPIAGVKGGLGGAMLGSRP